MSDGCCACGSYGCRMALLMDVKGRRNAYLIFADRCIAPELVSLWNEGVETVESCCGHGAQTGYIAVPDGYDDMMLKLGYKHQDLPEDFCQHCYDPKTIMQKS